LAKFTTDADKVGNVSGFTTTLKFRMALIGGVPLSVTLIETGLVELACETTG
jgi:hypothetical protein